MVTATTVRKLAERLERAEALVAEGAVYAVAGLPGYAVVKNGDGTQMYFVRYEAGHENCTCPDFKHRQRQSDQPCKHLLAAELALGDPNPPSPATAADPIKIDEARRIGMLAPAKVA